MTRKTALLLALTACGGGAPTQTPEAASPPVERDVPEAGAAAEVPEAGTTACTSDADCRAFDDTCGGCTCRPLRTDAPDPKCAHAVACFVAPCRAQRSLCLDGRCAIEAEGER